MSLGHKVLYTEMVSKKYNFHTKIMLTYICLHLMIFLHLRTGPIHFHWIEKKRRDKCEFIFMLNQHYPTKAVDWAELELNLEYSLR